jgi:hypothetical protein
MGNIGKPRLLISGQLLLFHVGDLLLLFALDSNHLSRSFAVFLTILAVELPAAL